MFYNTKQFIRNNFSTCRSCAGGVSSLKREGELGIFQRLPLTTTTPLASPAAAAAATTVGSPDESHDTACAYKRFQRFAVSKAEPAFECVQLARVENTSEAEDGYNHYLF